MKAQIYLIRNYLPKHERPKRFRLLDPVIVFDGNDEYHGVIVGATFSNKKTKHCFYDVLIEGETIYDIHESDIEGDFYDS